MKPFNLYCDSGICLQWEVLVSNAEVNGNTPEPAIQKTMTFDGTRHVVTGSDLHGCGWVDLQVSSCEGL
jgi:hypothetical protein